MLWQEHGSRDQDASKRRRHSRSVELHIGVHVVPNMDTRAVDQGDGIRITQAFMGVVMLSCNGAMCTATHDGSFDSALSDGWIRRKEFIFCPTCASKRCELDSHKIARLERENAALRKDNERLNALLDEMTQ